MNTTAKKFDFFVSYARADNLTGWVSDFVEALVNEHRAFTGGRSLEFFFDRQDIRPFSSWEAEIFNQGLTRSRLFLAFLSPAYFASEVCRREWKAWIDQEIAGHVFSRATAPIYFVEVPGLVSKPRLSEHEVAQRVAELCGLSVPLDHFLGDVAPVLRESRRRQVVSWIENNAVLPFYQAGQQALRQADLRQVLQQLAQVLDTRADEVRRADASVSTVPPYNQRFTGRWDELHDLRHMLRDDRTGVVCGVAGLGGIGKTELAFTYAHAFASVYLGGRFYLRCEHAANLRDAVLVLGDFFYAQISDDQRMDPDRHFAAVVECLRQRLTAVGSILLVLDNVRNLDLISRAQTDALTALGPALHLLATTRLLPQTKLPGQAADVEGRRWLELNELNPEESLELLEKHRPCADETERAAARSIVRRLGGFSLAIELVAAWLATHAEFTYGSFAQGLGLDDLETIGISGEGALRQHNHERQLSAVLGPVLNDLQPAERRALEYAALLAPDQVPLPWLKALVSADFPAVAATQRLSDPWADVVRRLRSLMLFTAAEGSGAEQRVVRVHRLVQDLIRQSLAPQDRAARQGALDALVQARDAELEQTTDWRLARWELEPLDALAAIWDDDQHPLAAWLMNQGATRWHTLAQWSRAEPLMRRALAIDEAAYGAEHPEVAIGLNNLAQLLQATNRLAEAEPIMRRALAIDEAAYGAKHPNVSRHLNNLAWLLKHTNRLTEAEPIMRRALAIDKAAYGAEHPDVARDLNNLALLLLDTNRIAEAEPIMRRALAINEAAYGTEHPNVAKHLNNLAQLLQATNRLAEAEPIMRRALAIDEAAYGAEHPDVAAHLCSLAQLLYATNRLAEAEPIIRRALAIDEAAYGAEHPSVARDLNNLAGLLQATNRLAEAELLMRRALAIDEAAYGAEHPDVARDLNNLALLLQDTNRLAEAEPIMRRHVEIFLNFTVSTGHPHPHLQAALGNYASLLQARGLDDADIQQCIGQLRAPYGL